MTLFDGKCPNWPERVSSYTIFIDRIIKEVIKMKLLVTFGIFSSCRPFIR